MNNWLSAEETLQAQGFVKTGTCNCGGVHNIKYRRGDFKVYFRPKKQQFRVKHKNHYITPLLPASDIININEHAAITA